MDNTISVLDTRQKELLRTLMVERKPISYKKLADIFNVSTRTIQREMSILTPILKAHNLKVRKSMGLGIEIDGEQEDLQIFLSKMKEAKTVQLFSPEDRRDGICYQLLLSKEPIKQYTFSKDFGVTEATVSHDLDKVESLIEGSGLQLLRTPGIGVYIEGTEQRRRKMLSRLLHKDIPVEEWISLFHAKNEKQVHTEKQIDQMIGNRLLKFIKQEQVVSIESKLRIILKDQKELSLTDRNYVNLIVHIMLAMERIKEGELIENTNMLSQDLVDPNAYRMAEKIVTALEREFDFTIPSIEIQYIALHLMGARVAVSPASFDQDEFLWKDYAQSFVRAVEHYLEEELVADELLIGGLIAHLVPAFTRLKHGLQVHNPLLKKIISNYHREFQACEKACLKLADRIGMPIPADEIGYLAMHIGAALIRKKEQNHGKWRALVVCASGFGTSTYLASKIMTEMPEIEVVKVVSMQQVEASLQKEPLIDLIISTIALPVAEQFPNVAIVSPFLLEEDIQKINLFVRKRKIVQSLPEKEPSTQRNEAFLALASYGEAVMNLTKQFTMVSVTLSADYSLFHLLEAAKGCSIIKDAKTVYQGLKDREKKGGFVVGTLAILHAKTSGVEQVGVLLFQLSQHVLWKNDNDEDKSVTAVLLLVASVDSPKEHVEMLSEISANLIEDQFVKLLCSGTQEQVRTELEALLMRAYEQKTVKILKRRDAL